MSGSVQALQDPNTDFAVSTIYTGRYDKVPCTAMSSLPTSITTGGGETETWNLPANIVFTPADIEYTIKFTGAATASRANFFYSNQFPLRRITVTHEGTTLLDLSNVITYTNLVSFSGLSRSRIQSMDKAYGANATAVGIHEFARTGINTDYFSDTFSASDATTSYIAWRANQTTDFMGMIASGATDPTATAASSIGFPTEIGSDYPTELFNATSVNTAAPAILTRVRMGDILKGTWFGIKKDFYAPGTIVINFTWEGSTRWTFESSATSTFQTAYAMTKSITVAGQKMLVPVQRDPTIIKEITGAYLAGSLKYIYTDPLLKEINYTSGTNQIPIQTCAAGVFSRIKMQIWGVYNANLNKTESFNHRMDESESENRKVRSFYTQLNDQRIQSTLIDLNTYDDWAEMRKHLQNSVVGLSSATYRKFWFWAEFYGLNDFVESLDSDELQGYDSSVRDYSYVVQATTTNRANLWIMIILGMKMITYEKGGGRMIIVI